MGVYQGRVTAVNGASGSPIFSIEDNELESLFGRSVCALGDVNGDLIPDFTVGAPHRDGGALNGGEIHVYSTATTDACVLRLVGAPSVSTPPTLRHLGHPAADSLILADVSPGPLNIPPFGVFHLGFTPALTPVNDSLGLFGDVLGSPLDSRGVMSLGPIAIPAGLVGVTVHLQAFALTSAAPNGFFQRSGPFSITFVP